MLLSRGLLKSLHVHADHYLDDRLFMYCEDVAVSHRARELGYKVIVARKAVAEHQARRISVDAYNAIRFYYGTRNTFLLIRDRPARQAFPSVLNHTFWSLARIAKNLAARRFSSARAIVWR